MAFRGVAIGVLLAGDPLGERREFSDEDERLLAAFADSAAIAVATARSIAVERLRYSIAAADRERGRWARELHDETLQGLGALRILLTSGRQRGSAEDLEAAVGQAISQLGTEIQNLRGLIAELRPAALDEFGLEAALQGLVERVSTAAGLAVETELSLSGRSASSGPEGPELESTVYRLVQEALTNVAKHSRAENVVLSVVERDGAIHVSVADDGVGFDPSAHHPGFGLLGMRERVMMAGGNLELSSSPGSGPRSRPWSLSRMALDLAGSHSGRAVAPGAVPRAARPPLRRGGCRCQASREGVPRRAVWHVNSTASGGGVAEMLSRSWPMREAPAWTPAGW